MQAVVTLHVLHAAAAFCLLLLRLAEIMLVSDISDSKKRPSCLIVSIFTFSSFDYRPIAERV